MKKQKSESEPEPSRGQDEEEGDQVSWFWAGDSAGGGHQDVWVQYDVATSKLIETGFKAGQTQVKVDDQRFFSLSFLPLLAFVCLLFLFFEGMLTFREKLSFRGATMIHQKGEL